jgi:hypothetical protein
MLRTILLISAALGLVACASQLAVQQPSAPLALESSAYEAAAEVTLPETPPQELPGLHNVYRLSDDIVSGAEPEGLEAFESLRDLGIKTVLSVDGKSPEHELAAEYGLRYVHVPIRYDGMTDEELLKIVKTFRELEGPFYVHCYHGKHRGPAAAAVGRLAHDGAPRGQALAEMRQWCGTSKKYEGLYQVTAARELPSWAETEAFEFDFAPAHRFDGLRGAMVDMTRSFDTIEDLMMRDWRINPDHPDASALNEAAKLLNGLEQSIEFSASAADSEEFNALLEASRDETRRLIEYLEAVRQGDPDAGAMAAQRVDAIGSLCSRCHASYRNNR